MGVRKVTEIDRACYINFDDERFWKKKPGRSSGTKKKKTGNSQTDHISNKIQNISSVIYTHEHADQTNGLFELRPFFWKNKKKINVYGDPITIKNLKRRKDYLFKNINS